MQIQQNLPSSAVWAIPGLKLVSDGRIDSLAEIDALIQAGCKFFDVDFSAIVSRTRKWKLSQPRQMMMNFLYHNGMYSLKTIGAKFNRDHTTVIHAMRTVADLSFTDESYRQRYNDLSDYLQHESFKFRKRKHCDT